MLLRSFANVFSNFHLTGSHCDEICISVYFYLWNSHVRKRNNLVGQERTNFALIFLSDIEDECSLIWPPSYVYIMKLSACESFRSSIPHPSNHRG